MTVEEAIDKYLTKHKVIDRIKEDKKLMIRDIINDELKKSEDILMKKIDKVFYEYENFYREDDHLENFLSDIICQVNSLKIKDNIIKRIKREVCSHLI